MKQLFTLALLFPFALAAQTTHNVEVGGSTVGATPPYFSPQFITINVGDTVRWDQVNGTHNVAGTLALYPNNPEGFTNGPPASGSWVYSHTFTIPGLYDYKCTQTGHGTTQFGTITVLDAQGIKEESNDPSMQVYPVPAQGILTVSTDRTDIVSVEIFSVDGRSEMTKSMNGTSKIELDITNLTSGSYIVVLTGTDGVKSTRPFTKK